ncbi:WxL domain-containing protein [Vagococcus zengguangii]|uniref:WxL domain-containing protein n=1 Tax=Vagococcus zengguangii TaxID=2571750 RepID=UPI001109241C|nr:WxL domain-containing protein [Vagococcus zengguangii]TLG78271.1 WxL domain-containing protein [Vagococcus zengguangii]
MKKTTIISTIIMNTLLLGGLMPAVSAEGLPQEASSEAGVGFEPNNEVVDPVDPNKPDPEKPINPTDPENPGTDLPDPETPNAGPISLDFASKLYFGLQKISTSNQTYYAAAQPYGPDNQLTTNYVQVTDVRGDDQATWKLSVKQLKDFTVPETTKTLANTKIHFTDGNMNTQAENSSAAPSVLNESFTLETGTQVDVVQASDGKGMGTWVLRFGTNDSLATNTGDEGTYPEAITKLNKEISLEVPGASTKLAEKYTTDLLWTLSDTP